MMPADSLLRAMNWCDLALVAQSGKSFWLPVQGSESAPVVDALFDFILWVSVFFFVLIVVLMIVFVIVYRRRPDKQPGPTATHNLLLELTWSGIPIVIVIIIFYWGFVGYMDMRTVPASAYEIRVTAQKWSWIFTYPNGHVDQVLHVPIDRPVRLTMTSEDVIHSLFIPAFRVKMDVVPGRYTEAWFRALKPGEYDLLCTEYCGKGHYDMLTKVEVHESGRFETWLEDAANLLDRMSPTEAGEELAKRLGCIQCHSTDGSRREGPSFKGIWGQTHNFDNASPTQVDDNYIRESILEPMAKIRSGYQGVMPTYKGRIKDEEITAIIEYIKSLK